MSTHLHLDDYPTTLGLLHAIAAGRSGRTDRLVDVGYRPTEHGAEVDWDLLLDSFLSSTEKAAVHVARGIKTLEHAGGSSAEINAALRAAIISVTGPLPIEFRAALDPPGERQ